MTVNDRERVRDVQQTESSRDFATRRPFCLTYAKPDHWNRTIRGLVALAFLLAYATVAFAQATILSKAAIANMPHAGADLGPEVY
jgi:hypothetical protein